MIKFIFLSESIYTNKICDRFWAQYKLLVQNFELIIVSWTMNFSVHVGKFLPFLNIVKLTKNSIVFIIE